jgi:hypothetical protein
MTRYSASALNQETTVCRLALYKIAEGSIKEKSTCLTITKELVLDLSSDYHVRGEVMPQKLMISDNTINVTRVRGPMAATTNEVGCNPN